MVQAAVSDIVCPAVPSQYPVGWLGEHVLLVIHGRKGLVVRPILQEFLYLHRDRFAVVAHVHNIQPPYKKFLELALRLVSHYGLPYIVREPRSPCRGCKIHAKTVLRIVLEQRIRPCGTMTLFILAVCRAGSVGRPYGGAARCVGYDHPVSVKLSDGLDVGRFTAAGARPVELEERLAELGALHRVFVHAAVPHGKRIHEIPQRSLQFPLRLQRLHFQRFFALLAGTYVRTVAAALAVQDRDLYAELVFAQVLSHRTEPFVAFGCVVRLFLSHQERPDGSVGTYECALVALYAVLRYPVRHIYCRAPLLVLGSARGEESAGIEIGGLQCVSLEVGHCVHDPPDELGPLIVHHHRLVRCVLPGSGIFDLLYSFPGYVHCPVVHFHDLASLS